MITIIGAGMAGLLAANILQNRGHEVQVLEAQKELPNNHKALLRFRSTVVSDVTGIEFKKVQMIKATSMGMNPVANSLSYAQKALGTYRSDRSITNDVIVADRYIAPEDFIQQLARRVKVKYGAKAKIPDFKSAGPIISTMPMSSLMLDLRYQVTAPFFPSVEGWVINATIHKCDAYATLYVPGPIYAFHRVSITGNRLIVEINREPAEGEADGFAIQAAHMMGINIHDRQNQFIEGSVSMVSVAKQKYAKILPIDDRDRKTFMAWATDNYNIYSLGRFATWRPGLLLDDIPKDVMLIEKWIKDGNNYNMKGSR